MLRHRTVAWRAVVRRAGEPGVAASDRHSARSGGSQALQLPRGLPNQGYRHAHALTRTPPGRSDDGWRNKTDSRRDRLSPWRMTNSPSGGIRPRIPAWRRQQSFLNEITRASAERGESRGEKLRSRLLPEREGGMVEANRAKRHRVSQKRQGWHPKSGRRSVDNPTRCGTTRSSTPQYCQGTGG